MNRFRSSNPRVAIAIAAVAMTVITFGLLVVAPATIENGSEYVRTPPAANVVTPPVSEVVIIPIQIDVLGVREKKLASSLVNNVTA